MNDRVKTLIAGLSTMLVGMTILAVKKDRAKKSAPDAHPTDLYTGAVQSEQEALWIATGIVEERQRNGLYRNKPVEYLLSELEFEKIRILEESIAGHGRKP